MHGLLADGGEVKHFFEHLQKYHPGTNVTVIDEFDRLRSLLALWTQVEQIRPMMEQVMKDHPDGVHLVCFSQGGLICRGVVETLPTHNVINFISLSSPQAGQYGDTNYLGPILPDILVKDAYKLLYTKNGQRISLANYWNDPHHQDLYQKWSAYLAVISNQSSTSHTFTPAFRENLLRVKNLILVGGPDDGVVTPWQSSQFGAFNENEEVVEYRQQQLYTEDWFGLKTLDARGSLQLYTFAGVHHKSWHKNVTVFEKAIEPWLT
jgi:palmitoyl-protein thioesterase